MDLTAFERAREGRDVSGRDLSDIPRYPGSRRIFFRRDRRGSVGIYSLAYLCEGRREPPRTVINFMREGMRKKGWYLASEAGMPPVMLFVKGNGANLSSAEIFFGSSVKGESIIYVVVQSGS